MKSLYYLWLAFLALAASATYAEEAAPDYTGQIAPIFNKYCTGCHNTKEHEGELSLESFALLQKGGEHGQVVVPGKSDESKLLLVLTGKAEPAMPPEDNEKPSEKEIALIERWIAAGAKGPTAPVAVVRTLVTPKIMPTVPVHEAISAVAWSPLGGFAAVGRVGAVEVLRVADRSRIRTLTSVRGRVNALSFSADGTKLLAAAGEPGMAGEVRLWSGADFTLIQTFEGHADSIYAAVLSPDGELLATSSYDQQVKLWNVATGKELRTLAGHNDAVYDLAFRPDGKVLASASGDRTVKLWNVATGARLDTLAQPLKELYAIAFSPDGRRLVAGGADNRIRMWQITPDAKENSNPIVYSRFAHEGPVIKLIYTPDGRNIISASEDRSVKVWDADSLTEKLALERQTDWAAALAASPDSKTLLVGRMNGTLAAYDLASGHERAELAGISLRGVQSGVTNRRTLMGKNLGGVTEVRFTSRKMSGKVLSAKAEQAEIEITPSADAHGRDDFWLVGLAGETGRLAVHVDNLPQFGEVEPNGGGSQGVRVALPSDVWGTLDAVGDIDHYRFEAKAGQTVVCEVAAKSLGSKLSAQLTLLNSAGDALAGDSTSSMGQDPVVGFHIPADGLYTLKVADEQLAGSADHYYRVAVGAFAYALATYPLSVPAEKNTDIELLGFNLPPAAKVVTVPATKGSAAVVPLDAKTRTSKPLDVLVGGLPEVVETEPNDTPGQATVMSAPGRAGGRIWKSGVDPNSSDAFSMTSDSDLFRFESKAGEKWMIETEAAQRRSPTDTVIEVLHADGRPVERLLLQAVRDSAITFRPIDGNNIDARLVNWEEMELNELLYMNGEVVKLWRAPQGPDSGFLFYPAAGGSRRAYFDTTVTAHALDEPAYIVEPRLPGSRLPFTGLPTFTLNYQNDDESERRLGSDSRLMFTAPADGACLVRVRDTRDKGGERFTYRLTVRRPQPDFNVTVGPKDRTVPRGGGRSLDIVLDRLDDFDGDVKIEITGLPPGFHVSSPVVVQAGHREAKAIIFTDPDAQEPAESIATQSLVKATAIIEGREVVKPIGTLGRLRLGPKPSVIVHLEPKELVIAPGTTVSAKLRVERNGYDDVISFTVDNRPHGVIVANVGLVGIIMLKGQSEREIFLTAAPWVPETSRTFFAQTVKPVTGEASPPAVLHVRKPSGLAAAK